MSGKGHEIKVALCISTSLPLFYEHERNLPFLSATVFGWEKVSAENVFYESFSDTQKL